MLETIEEKIAGELRITTDEALWLYENAPTQWLQKQADFIRQKLHSNKTFYNRNIHFEPTNKCIYSCKFCSFYRKPNATEEDGAWDYSLQDLEEKLAKYGQNDLTEIHITGGVHPDRGIDWAVELLTHIKKLRPSIHIKAFTAVEVTWMCKVSKVSLEEGLKTLQKAGLDSLPGGGAEIFDPEIRRKIAGGKAPADRWLEVHGTAHRIGVQSNATMLYGHIEKFRHRVDHMDKLRKLQDESHGFNSFIPLRYRNENNKMSGRDEVTQEEDFRNFAIARIFLDNIKHLKAYWVMLGVENAFASLDYGVDDLDGTVDDTTKIYSMAGSMDSPALTSQFLIDSITELGRLPIERDSLYQEIK
ncbi:MAG: CofH family radical SAM protein [Lentisphaerales bacterium]|nr:CofH family radical SAM protein [Lentisphaerales bacterium]